MIAKERLLTKGVYVVVLKASGVLLSYAFTLYITNALGAKVFGQYSLFYAIVNILSIIALFGTDRSVIRLFNEKDTTEGHRNVTQAIVVVIVSACLFTLILYGSWKWVATTFFSSDSGISGIRNFSIVLLFYSLYLFIAESLRAKNKMIQYGLLRFDLVYVFAILLLYFLIRYEIPWPHIASFCYAVFVTAAIGLLLFLRQYKFRLVWDPQTIRKILHVSYPMLLASSMGLIIGWIDTFMLGYFADEAAVGIYNVAFKVAFITTFLLTTINTVISPRIAKLNTEGKHRELKKLIHKVSKTLFIGASVIFLATIFNMKWVLSLFGPEFTEGVLALALLLIGQFISSYSGPVGVLLQMTGHEKTFMYISVAAMVINVILNLLLIPRLGYVGAAAASAITLIFLNLCSVYFVRKKLGILTLFIPFRKIKDADQV